MEARQAKIRKADTSRVSGTMAKESILNKADAGRGSSIARETNESKKSSFRVGHLARNPSMKWKDEKSRGSESERCSSICFCR